MQAWRRPKKRQSDQDAKPADQAATIGYEADLGRMADTLRGSIALSLVGPLRPPSAAR